MDAEKERTAEQIISQELDAVANDSARVKENGCPLDSAGNDKRAAGQEPKAGDILDWEMVTERRRNYAEQEAGINEN